mmetsp:Transcript_40604/g.62474  ORF Transcript_40604/g.62474 Transcript_40604/m.62474 type:complete len:214 (-) Transcript_40604:895-1536(-)
MRKRVLAAEAKDAEGEVLGDGGCRLTVHEVAVHKSVFEEGGHGVHVVLAHLADVLEQEGQRLEHAVLDVELGEAVLVEEGGEDGEGAAGLSHDGDRNGRAHPVLPLLHLEVIQQHGQHILRPNRFRNVPERVHRRPPNRLLVRLEHVEELEADAHPLFRRHKLRPPIGDAADEVDAVLLDLLVAVAEDGGEAGEQVFDGGRHFGHAHHVDDPL